MEANSPKQPELFEQIESFISGLLRFVVSFFVTVRDFLGSPRKFGSRISEDSGPYTRPYSFLTLSSFSLATVARYSIVCVFLSLIDMFRGCSNATQLPLHYLPASDLLKIPKLEDIIYLALPSVLLVIVIARSVSWVVIKRTHSTVESRRITRLIIYASGMQFILIPMAAGLVFLATAHWGFNWTSSRHLTLWAILFSSPAIIWPAFCVCRAAMILKSQQVLRVSHKWLGEVFVGFVCVTSLVTTLVASIAVSYLLAAKDVKGAGENAPMISATFLYLRQTGARAWEMAVIARNNSEGDLWVEADKIGLFGKIWTRSYIAVKDIQGGVLELPPGRDVVIPLKIEAVFENDVVKAKALSLTNSSAPLFFSSVDHLGHWQPIAVVPEPGGEVDAEKLEAALTLMRSSLQPAPAPLGGG